MPHKAGTGAIRGIVSEDGIPSQKRVTLMDRSNFRRLATIVSGVDGDYTFSGLDPETDDYMVFAVDDDKEVDGNYKDPIIYDRVRPINAVIGVRQTNEWFYLAQKKSLRANFIPIPSSPLGDPTTLRATSSYGAGRWFPLGAENTDAGYLGVSPVIPNLGNVRFDSCVAAMYVPSSHQYNSTITRWNPVTLEWVLDTANVSGNPAIYVTTLNRLSLQAATLTPGTASGGSDSSSVGTWGYIGYIPSRRTIQMGYSTSTSGSQATLWTPFSSNLSSLNGNENNNVLEYVIPQELVGTPIHIHAVINHVSSTLTSKLYVNGVKVAEKYLSNGPSIYSSDGNAIHFIIGGSVRSGVTQSNSVPLQDFNNVSANTCLAALYQSGLTDSEVAQLHNALFDPLRTPAVPTDTGYYYAVNIRRPFLFFPFNEAPTEAGTLTVVEATSMRWSLSRQTSGGTVTVADSSIIRGRSLLKFENGAVANTAVSPLFPGADGVSVSFVAAPKLATPATTETLATLIYRYTGVYSTDAVASWAVRRTTAGKFQIAYGSTATFNTLPEIDVQHHYTFTLDRLALVAKMYVDGVWVETVSIAGTLPANLPAQVRYYAGSNNEYNYSTILSFGATYSLGSRTVSPSVDRGSFYNGDLGAFSIHPFVMSDTDVEELYDYLDVM